MRAWTNIIGPAIIKTSIDKQINTVRATLSH